MMATEARPMEEDDEVRTLLPAIGFNINDHLWTETDRNRQRDHLDMTGNRYLSYLRANPTYLVCKILPVQMISSFLARSHSQGDKYLIKVT